MKFAAVDIGSNAIRFQISTVLNNQGDISFKKLEYIRFPLRLGHDVFIHKKISAVSEAKFLKLMKAFSLLIDLYEVDDLMICATSAMRESTNGPEIADKVKKETDLLIEIIDGEREAEMINDTLSMFINDKEHLHIDVGGGSTELNLYQNGGKIASRSFQIGSVRKLENMDTVESWLEMESWVKSHVDQKFNEVTAIGTGGNINKIFELAEKKSGYTLSLKKIEEIRAYLMRFSIPERINILRLNPDRADVIIPASEIYIAVMKWARAKKMKVPAVGLKDGIIKALYEKNR
ncbi:phosphatase [Fulvivirgaceae bacterium BMA12]|uniref:Phosphatase n=1 Tax=Agaribacillus aureus TaxID=3051825 RepID=A0ABT8L795_9BACT|nr:phosphatase [Fulvivirgaceae bacterium BMA12]